MEEVTIKIDAKTKEMIDRYKKETGIPIKYIVRNAIKEYVREDK